MGVCPLVPVVCPPVPRPVLGAGVWAVWVVWVVVVIAILGVIGV